MTREEKGMEIFSRGYNCAQSVVGAFADRINIPWDEAVKMASPFGGGMGRMREVCGAVSGMFIVLGCLKGYSAPDRETQAKLYENVQCLSRRFREENGSIICRELLGLDEKPQDPTPDKRDAGYYKKRPCRELVGTACRILDDYLNSLG